MGPSVKYIVSYADFELETFVALFVDKEPASNTLCKPKFEILYEILEVHLVSEIETSWVKAVNIHIVAKN